MAFACHLHHFLQNMFTFNPQLDQSSIITLMDDLGKLTNIYFSKIEITSVLVQEKIYK